MTNFNVGCVMNLQDRVAFLREQGIVAIVRADSSEGLVRVVEAVAAAGEVVAAAVVVVAAVQLRQLF